MTNDHEITCGMKTKEVLDNEFQWRDQHGNKHRVKNMETRHLFNTLCMIWNHTMPMEAATRPDYKRYRFSSYYSEQYMIAAIKSILPELVTRDLNTYQKRALERMSDYFNKRLKKLGYRRLNNDRRTG